MLKLENVSFRVDVDGKGLGIIDNLSLEIPDGGFTVITGPNGGGKSTLARLIMGIEKPTSGKIYYNANNGKNYHSVFGCKVGNFLKNIF